MSNQKKVKISMFHPMISSDKRRQLQEEGLFDCEGVIVDDLDDEKEVEFDNGIRKIVANEVLIEV